MPLPTPKWTVRISLFGTADETRVFLLSRAWIWMNSYWVCLTCGRKSTKLSTVVRLSVRRAWRMFRVFWCEWKVSYISRWTITKRKSSFSEQSFCVNLPFFFSSLPFDWDWIIEKCKRIYKSKKEKKITNNNIIPSFKKLKTKVSGKTMKLNKD